MAIDLRIFDRNYKPSAPSTAAQSAFEAMTAAAEKNVIRDPNTKGVLGYTEAAGVRPLPGQTVNIYNPQGTEVLRTITGQPLQSAQSEVPFDMSALMTQLNKAFEGSMMNFNSILQQSQKLQAESAQRQQDFLNSFMRSNAQMQQTQPQTASVQTAAPQNRRMGSIGSSFGRGGGLRIKSVNI